MCTPCAKDFKGSRQAQHEVDHELDLNVVVLAAMASVRPRKIRMKADWY